MPLTTYTRDMLSEGLRNPEGRIRVYGLGSDPDRLPRTRIADSLCDRKLVCFDGRDGGRNCYLTDKARSLLASDRAETVRLLNDNGWTLTNGVWSKPGCFDINDDHHGMVGNPVRVLRMYGDKKTSKLVEKSYKKLGG